MHEESPGRRGDLAYAGARKLFQQRGRGRFLAEVRPLANGPQQELVWKTQRVDAFDLFMHHITSVTEVARGQRRAQVTLDSCGGFATQEAQAQLAHRLSEEAGCTRCFDHQI